MIAALAVAAVLAGGGAPSAVTIATPRGEFELPVRYDATGAPILAAPGLVSALDGTVNTADGWVEITTGALTLRFLLGAPLYVVEGRVEPLAASVSVIRDTIFVPFQVVAEVLPEVARDRFRYDRTAARLIELVPATEIVTTSLGSTGPKPADAPERLPNGLLPGHLVTIDAGHGGADPGNPGMFFPGDLREKDVTLKVALLLRQELEGRGVEVRMTRTTDVLPDLLGRAPMCGADCDLFLSLHVDALDPRRTPHYRTVNGFHTLIIGEENTEDANRVARMENEALRFESVADQKQAQDDLGFLLRDLQMNEFLRESAQAAALLQQKVAQIHPGENRGVRQSNRLAVLNTARRPALLFEMGYSTNRSDARFLTTAASQRRLASAIADAIVAYLLEYERRTGAAATAAQ